jgi:hypothetical protein
MHTGQVVVAAASAMRWAEVVRRGLAKGLVK